MINIQNDSTKIKILECIVDSIDEAIHAINNDGITIYYNKKAAQLDGLDQFDVIGKHLLKVYPSLTEDTSTLLRVVQSSEPIYHQQQQFKNFRDELVHTLNTTLPIIIDGKQIGALEIAKDLSEINTLQEEISELQSQIYQPATVEQIEKNIEAHYQFEDIITKDRKMKKLKNMAQKAAHTNSPVLITGETGTGKELIAQSIHNASIRREQPFVAQNCAALPESLLEGILFGTVKGSFTGASDRPGLFELANGGTLFLDEIHSMPMGLQSKLLRVLQEGYVRRVADTKLTPVDVRIIAAMNIDPVQAVHDEIIRSDLFYRINVVSLTIPPLRSRKQDISLLINTFMKKYNYLFNKLVTSISKEAVTILKNYSWPGNVRELEHAVESAMNLVESEQIKVEHIPQHIKSQSLQTNEHIDIPYGKGLRETIEDVEKQMIENALIKEDNNIFHAAKLLDIPRQTLQYKINKYNLKDIESE